ncbi:MYND-type domain-containing protein [Mycena indigotica]|uniref:MYND-type domain-containing protein n=1 Tax=Mycena indigotica TaxID=2126181 RepID=A0A8H6S200_9AGAR|nr:MYND-type domain-containing protein [Mycena indigotica]KAF7290760.1 MYND-type domain-containing protein [Mycena indigotica]
MLGRQEVLELLKSMGIELPRKTKLPDAELDKRLTKALDSAQYLSRVIPDPPLDPRIYPSWFENPSNAKLLDGVRRHSFGEASLFAEGKDFPLYGNAFWDLRQTVMGIGNACDTLKSDELPPIAVQDKEGLSGIVMRVLEVKEFDKNTPIIVLLYRHDVRSTVSQEAIAWLRDNRDEGRSMATVTATLKEQELLLRLLKQNSRRIAKKYQPKRLSTESAFTCSFILPVGPLTAKDTAKYSANNGCTICGEPAKSKCSRCGVVRYCGSVCQRDDWKAHKALCNQLKGARWHRLTFIDGQQLPSIPGAVAFTWNKFDIVQHRVERLEKQEQLVADEPPENTHGSSTFIVKVQLSSSNARGPGYQLLQKQFTPSELEGSTMLIYDQKRVFEVTVMRDGDRASFDAVADVVRSKGERGLKVFCWAVRTADWTVDICLDHLPDWQNW